MSRNKKVLRNIVLTLFIVFIFFPLSGLYLTPMSAHKASERSIHYGPSKVVHVEDFDGGKYMLSKYDKWASCNTVNRSLFFFWSFGNQVTGFEKDTSKAIDYTWDMTDEVQYKLYGIINDNRIEKIEITLSNNETLTTRDFYEDMFIFTWKNEGQSNYKYLEFKNIKGYDQDENLIFEDERPS